MGYYDALIAKWATLPAGDTTAQKLALINAATVTLPAEPAIFAPSQIINAIVPADLASLTTAQVALLTLVLAGSSVDGSVGTTIRAAVQNIFSGKTTTLANLSALVAPFDHPTIPWWQATVAQGGGGLSSAVNSNDLVAAGGLT